MRLLIMYSLRDPFNGKAVEAKLNEQTILFAYKIYINCRFPVQKQIFS